jgi:hypothetical protein
MPNDDEGQSAGRKFPSLSLTVGAVAKPFLYELPRACSQGKEKRRGMSSINVVQFQ